MIPSFCIQRPVATTLLALGVVMAGLAGYQLVPVAALPQVDFPTINVTAQLSGASPQTMATSVSTPLIKQFETIPGISEISSTNSLGNTSIVLQFDLNRDIDAAAADVQAAISHATRQLPDNLTTPPSYRKTNPADAPIMLMAVQSDTMPRSKLDEIAEDIISPSLSTLPGVAEVSVYGAQTYAVRVEVDPSKLQARGIGVDTVNQAIAAANNQNPVGTLQNKSQTMTINANTQRTNAEQFRSLVIASPHRPVAMHHARTAVLVSRSAGMALIARSQGASCRRPATIAAPALATAVALDRRARQPAAAAGALICFSEAMPAAACCTAATVAATIGRLAASEPRQCSPPSVPG